jgi:hypothetical protein
MVLLGVLATATPARAVLISGFGTPISDPALAGGTVITFDATTAGAYGSLAIGNATFIGVDAPFNIGADFNGSFNTSGGQSLFNGTDFVPAQFRVDFATPVDAFAFNWGAADNQWLLSAFDSANNLIEANLIPAVFSSNAGDYIGVAAADIAFLTLVDQKNNAVNGDFVFIDSFTYRIGEDGPVPVPEPATLGLLAAGLATFALLSRRRKIGQSCRIGDNG